MTVSSAPGAEGSVAILAQGVGQSVHLPDSELQILRAVDLSIGAGESVALIGPSGSGKSTLLGLLAGLDTPSSGRIWLFDDELTALDEDGRARVRGARVGFVFQNFQLLPSLNALENVMLPLELGTQVRSARDRRARALELLDQVGLFARTRHYPRQLSGGEQQRVAIARAFASQPQILFADEPTGNLDEETGGRVVDLLFDLNRRTGTTLVLVTHDPNLARRCERSYRIQAGELAPMTETGATL